MISCFSGKSIWRSRMDLSALSMMANCLLTTFFILSLHCSTILTYLIVVSFSNAFFLSLTVSGDSSALLCVPLMMAYIFCSQLLRVVFNS